MPPQDAPALPAAQDHSLRNATLAFAAIVALWLIGGWLNAALNPDPVGDRFRAHEARQLNAISTCQQFVRKRLAAPGTAAFDPAGILAAVNAQGNWTVGGWLESQNSLGVPLREPYACELSRRGDRWTLESLQIGSF